MTIETPDAFARAASTDAADAVLLPLLHALEDLERCLEAESAALIDGDAGILFAAVERKRSALRTVEVLMREPRLQALLSRSAAGADAPAAAFDASGAEGALARDRLMRSPTWPRMLEQLLRCRNLNQAAGGAIATSRRSTNQLLHLLGRTPEPATYGVDGSAPAETGGRDLAVC